MEYEVQELMRCVGINGVTQEEVTAIINDWIAVRVRVNQIVAKNREEMMKKDMQRGLTGGLATQAGY